MVVLPVRGGATINAARAFADGRDEVNDAGLDQVRAWFPG